MSKPRPPQQVFDDMLKSILAVEEKLKQEQSSLQALARKVRDHEAKGT